MTGRASDASRKAGMRDQAAEARPARVFLVAVEWIEIADAVRKNDDRVRARITQVLLRPQLAADELERSTHALLVDESFGSFFRDVEFDSIVHCPTPW